MGAFRLPTVLPPYREGVRRLTTAVQMAPPTVTEIYTGPWVSPLRALLVVTLM